MPGGVEKIHSNLSNKIVGFAARLTVMETMHDKVRDRKV